MSADYERKLHRAVAQFVKEADKKYPNWSERNDNGEWGIGLDKFDDMYKVILEIIEYTSCDEATEQMLDDILFGIARDNECSRIIEVLLKYPDWYALLCEKVLFTEYINAKWQFEESLKDYHGKDEIKALEENVSGTKLDKKQEKYLAPIVLEDDVLGKLVLEKSEGLFEGTYHFLGNDITIYIEVEWSSKATWKKPLAVARDFVEHIVSRDEAFREYIAADEALYDAALECLEDYEDECEIHFSTPEEFANALKERMKYIFVNQNGSYTIGYDDGYVFGGHEIDVDVDSKGKMVCADMR